MREQRQALDWPQARLAAELEVDVGSVSRWERGELEVDRRTVLAIERLADVHQKADDPTDRLTLKEAAAEAAAKGEPISPDTLRSQAAKGKLKTEKRGRDLVVTRHELRNYLENRARTGRRAAGSVSAAARARAPAKRKDGKGMPPEQFEELLESVRQGGAILRGEAKPARATKGGVQPDASIILDCTPPDFMAAGPPAAGKTRPGPKRPARAPRHRPRGGAPA